MCGDGLQCKLQDRKDRPHFLPRMVPHVYNECFERRRPRPLFVRAPSPLTRRAGDDNQTFWIVGRHGPFAGRPLPGRVFDADTVRASHVARNQRQGLSPPPYVSAKCNAIVLVDITSIVDYYSNTKIDPAIWYKLADRLVDLLLETLKDRFNFPFETHFTDY